MELICTEQVRLNEEFAAADTKKQSQQNVNLHATRYVTGSTGSGKPNLLSAVVDPTFLTDRCLENLLKTEEKFIVSCSYFKPNHITPSMRKIVAEWMMEVCEEEKCQEEVVLLALNYMDRFLNITPTKKTHLQTLAAACLLLASKLREPSCRSLTADLLVFYTDNSIHKQDLIHWELYVLSRLKWDLSTVTPLDFLELLLIRLPIRNLKCPDITIDKIRLHAQAFISLAAKEHYFSIYPPSAIACSSIAAALHGLNWDLRTGIDFKFLLSRLTDLTGCEQDFIRSCMNEMEKIFEEHSRNIQKSLELNAFETQNLKVTEYSDCRHSVVSGTSESLLTKVSNELSQSYKVHVYSHE